MHRNKSLVAQLTEGLSHKEGELAQYEDRLARSQSECDYTRELLSKAQEVIKKLSQDTYLDTNRVSTAKPSLREEEARLLEQRLQGEYEARFTDVQRKGEQIIAYYKNELRRAHSQLD